MKRLHLGAGEDLKGDYINLDLYKSKGVDIVHDLNKYPYPFKDNEVDEILCNYIIEHLDDPYKVLLELHRISKAGAIIKIKVPHFSGGDAWNDLQHRKGFGTLAFRHDNIKDKFKLLRQRITFPKRRSWLKWFANKYPGFYDYNLAYIFPASDLHIILRVKK